MALTFPSLAVVVVVAPVQSISSEFRRAEYLRLSVPGWCSASVMLDLSRLHE